MRQEIAAIWAAVEAEEQDKQLITRLVQEFNAHEEYPVMVSIVESPSSGRIGIIPIQK